MPGHRKQSQITRSRSALDVWDACSAESATTTPALNGKVLAKSITVLATVVTGIPFLIVTCRAGSGSLCILTAGRPVRLPGDSGGRLTAKTPAGGAASKASPCTTAASWGLATARYPANATAAAIDNTRSPRAPLALARPPRPARAQAPPQT